MSNKYNYIYNKLYFSVTDGRIYGFTYKEMIAEKMTKVMYRKREIEGLINLYHLMIHADGKISDREIHMGEIMCKYENIDKELFERELELANQMSFDDVYKKCLNALKACDHEFNVKCIAWMSLIANSDGFMSTEEWGIIYKLYAYELHLDLKEILDYQKSLPKH